MYYSALLGKPVDHSISPLLFNILAKKNKLEYAHLKIEVISENLLKDYIKSLQTLNFKGVNVTLPYKISVMKYLDEVDITAKKIGAVNTIVFRSNKMIGYNTDAIGALLAIENNLKKVSYDDAVMMIGSGGAARAIAYEFYKRCKHINILSIDLEQAKKLSADISGNKINVNELNENNLKIFLRKSNIIINTTPIGMFPQSNEEIINKKIFDNFGNMQDKYFFDVILNPYKTKLLSLAESKGAKICSGLYMMIYQGIYSFELFIDQKLKNINVNSIYKRLAKILDKNN